MVFRVVRQFASLLARLRLQFDGYRIVGCARVKAWGIKNTTRRVEIFLDQLALALTRARGVPYQGKD